MRTYARLRHLTHTVTASSRPKYLQPPASSSTSIRTMADKSLAHSKLSFLDDDVRIVLPPELTPSVLRDFIPYKTWRNALNKSLAAQSNPSHPFHNAPYKLRSIEVQSCDFFGGSRLGFLKLNAKVTNNADERLPGSIFMRGGSVAMLIVLQPDSLKASQESGEEAAAEKEEKEYVILTVQPRIPAGSLSFTELPAGMIDDSGTFTGAAAKEIKEETGLDIREDELIDMTKLAITAQDDDTTETTSDEIHLQQATYPSPGGCDEFIPIFLVRKRMPGREIRSLRGKLTGLRDHGEKITLRVCKLGDLWKVGARDGKTLAALALYEGLRRERKV